MKQLKALICSIALFAMFAGTAAQAKTEIQWWHAFGGRLGELLNEQVEKFNASQDKYTVVHTRKGNYSETLNAGIAAFRAGQHPNILMVFEVGTASLMAAKGAYVPMYQLMKDAGQRFNPNGFVSAVSGYYTTTDGKMLSMPYNSSTPVLWVNKDLMKKAGLDPEMDLSTWKKVGNALDAAKAKGIDMPFCTCWHSWIHLENFSAYHNIPFATKSNGFAGLDTELAFNSPVHIKHIQTLGKWAQEGKFKYMGRRNEAGKNFRAGECMLMTESSAGYAGIKKQAKFDFAIRHLPYYGATEAPQNTIIGGSSLWALSGKSKEENKATAAFLAFLSRTDIQAKWHQDTGYLGVTTAAAKKTKSSGFYKANPGTDLAGIQMMRNKVTQNSKGLRLGSFDQIRGIIDEEMEGVYSGKKTAQVALDSAVKRGNVLLRRFERANK
ncbi:sn-glycerol-3-phosphate ABC transporter substrate-binding protein UgpB [Candidatus Pelagibacter bacterium]|nr:sn-glycerol-3-phosphate ABC transporter substrate-binding protein UgpB [Candidatus Pelagibacter bacterium]